MEQRLDELLDELQGRIEAARGTRERVHGLLEAVLSVGRGLDLEGVLRRVVEAAVALVDAEYGALGVIGEDGRLSAFVPVGVDEEQEAAIGEPPRGRGVLGELIRHPEPLRLAEVSRHPAFHGFPPHHPEMHSFLGVPVRVGDEVFGNLYVTQKRGGGEFDADDEALLSLLAMAAGVAVENARLYGEAQSRQRWLAANAGVTGSVLRGMETGAVLELIVERAREVLDTGLAVLAVPEEGGGRVALARGVDAAAWEGRMVPAEGSFVEAALAADGPVAVEVDRGGETGPAVAVALRGGERARGVLLLARTRGKPAFTRSETASLRAFAGQAAVAMELAERRRDAERIAVFEDRERIARDLHDLAIQRLFAAGMTLQGATRYVTDPKGSEQVLRVVDDLDETIRIIRSAVFGLRRHEPGAAEAGGLRARAARVVEEATGALGFTPSLRTEGFVDTDVPRAVADEAVPVLAEALSNVARHARARTADVALVAGAGELTVSVTDDGVGMAEGVRLSGLTNLSERAERLGGELRLEAPPGGGTRLVWRVPLP
jgi:signal transduction histidine kinase